MCLYQRYISIPFSGTYLTISFTDAPFSKIISLLKATALIQTNKNISYTPQAIQEETLGRRKQNLATI